MTSRFYVFIVFTFLSTAGRSQDSTKITYSLEPDTLVKQRFIDRYENVFMTKVATKHMFKLGLMFASNDMFSLGYSNTGSIIGHLGYEYKVSPALSVGTDFTANGGWGSEKGWMGTFTGSAYARWYYDIASRMRQGIQVNNFTGNYVSVVAERRWNTGAGSGKMDRFGLEYGLQRRFFNWGRLDFGVGVFYQNGYRPTWWLTDLNGTNGLAIATRTSLGLAFGDWRKQRPDGYCEVLRCEDFVQQQWKLAWPRIFLSRYFMNGMAGLGYERKIKASPFSVNAQVFADFYHVAAKLSTPNYIRSEIQIHPSLQLRYYLTQKSAIRKGKSGNNLSGVYLAPQFDYLLYNNPGQTLQGANRTHLGIGAVAGYQQTLFKRAYVDFSLGFSKNLLTIRGTQPYIMAGRMGFGLTF